MSKTKQETTESESQLALSLKIDKIQHDIDKILQVTPILNNIANETQEVRDYVAKQLTEYAMSIRSSKLNKDGLEPFFKHPYILYKKKGDNDKTWHLAIPKFVDAQFGWLEQVTESHNVFVVNPYVDWVGDIPQSLKDQIGMKDPLDLYLDGDALVGKDLVKAREKYKGFIKKDEKDRLIIDKSRHFELLSTLIKDGILPFVPRPIDKSAFSEINRFREGWELRDYHREAWEMFKKYSNIGYFLPPSGGKTFLSIHALASLTGPHLVCVPSTLLQQQWIDRIELYTDLKVSDHIEEGVEVVVMTYQSAIKHAHKMKWKIVIVDECHHLPANYFSKLATILRDFLIGLTATPQREDNREDYIFALTGKPVGLSWDSLKKLGIIKSPDMNVWIVRNEKERMEQLDRLLQNNLKTIIFCDSIDMGKAVAKKYDIPHVYGDTKQRLDKIQDSLVSVVSRVGDEGVSLPDIRQVIEIDWLFGSRRQETQRFTRLLHGKNIEGVGHIIMTIDQYQHDHKRLFGIMDKGFKIILHREGISDKIVHMIHESTESTKTKSRQTVTKATAKPTVRKSEQDKFPFESTHPILSLPGIQKKLVTLSNPMRQCVNIMFQNPTKAFSKEDFIDITGATSLKSQSSFGNLINMGLAEKTKDGLYMAHLGKMSLVKHG